MSIKWHHLTRLSRSALVALCLILLAQIRWVKAKEDTRPAAARPRLVVQLGHSASVEAVAWSPDGRFVLTGSADHTACLWEAATGIEIQRYRGHTKAVHSVAFTPDGRSVITGSFDGTIRFWDTATGKEQRHIEADPNKVDSVRTVASSPDGKYVLTTGYGVTLWNIATGQAERELKGHTNAVNYAAFSPDSRFILTGSIDRTARLWETASGKQLHAFTAQVFKRHPNPGIEVIVPPVAFSRDGKWILTGGDIAILWDSETKQEVKRFATNGGQVDSVAISPDGRYVLTGERPLDFPLVMKLRWWDAATGAELRSTQWPISIGSDDIALAFSPDGRSLLAACGSAITAFDSESGREIQSFAGYAGKVSNLAMAQESGLLLTGSDSGQAQLWDLQAGQQGQRFLPSPSGLTAFVRGLDGVEAVAISTDGRLALVGRRDGTATLWDTATGKLKQTFKVGRRGIQSVALSPDPEGQYVLISSGEEATLWETSTAKILHRFPQGFGRSVWSVAFSPDGRSVLIGSSGLMQAAVACRWDIASGKLLDCLNLRDLTWQDLKQQADPSAKPNSSLPRLSSSDDAREAALSNGIPCVAFSPDGHFIAVAKGNSFASIHKGGVRVFEAATGKQVQYFVPAGNISCVAFSPDGNYLLTGSSEGILCLWDRRTEKEAHSFMGHASAVESVAFTADGRFFVTGSEDGTTRFWNAQTAQEICQLVSFDDGRWIVVDPEGRFDTNSLEEIRGLRWVMPDDPLTPLPLEIYMREYYQPQLLDLLLRGESLKPVRDISRISRVQPKVKIVSVTSQADSPELVNVVVEVAQAAKSSGVFDLRLFRDGQLVAQSPQPLAWEKLASSRSRLSATENLQQWRVKTRIETDQLGQQRVTFPNVRLPRLEKGSVIEFSAYAFNNDRVKSATHRWSHKIEQTLPPVKRRAFLVTIGVNQTQNDAWSLLIAGNDAQQMQRRLSEHLAKNAEYQVIPIQLTAQQATKGNIQAVLRWLAGQNETSTPLPASLQALQRTEKAGPEDVLILSISSHGVKDQKGNFYLLPYDIGKGRSATLRDEFFNRCISSEELTGWLREIDASVMALIIDACYSAAAVKTAEFKPGPMGDPGLGQLAYDKGIQILAASQPEQKALDSSEIALSYLTQALIPEGLVKGQADQFPPDGKITLLEWLRYGVKRVPELHAKEFQPKQWQFSGQANSTNKSVLQRPVLFDFSRKLREVVLVRHGEKLRIGK